MEDVLRGGLCCPRAPSASSPKGKGDFLPVLRGPAMGTCCAEAVRRAPGTVHTAPCVQTRDSAPLCPGSSPLVSGIFRKGKEM